jgi:hypothetical protein
MISLPFFTLLFLLVAAHALADYPLQGEFLSQAKNRNTAIGKVFWPHALFAHAMIHGGFVLLLTGSMVFAVGEVILHAFIDWAKCEGKISLNADQAFHLFCKLGWAVGTVMVAA